MKYISCITILLAVSAALAADPSPAPCSAPEFRQLDFWVGDWDLTWPGNDGKPVTGTNHVVRALGGCVIEENFAAAGPAGLIGRSVSVYSTRQKSWQQTWVDNQGGYIALTGGPEGKDFVLRTSGTTPDGKPVLRRMVFTDITPDAFEWRWESSTDDGKTWTVGWPIHYRRKKP